MSALERFLSALRPLLERQGALGAWIFGSHARGGADPRNDIDVIIVTPSTRPPVDRFRDYLEAIVAAGVGVDLFVYTPDEFQTLQAEERPFLVSALDGAVRVYEG